MDSHDPLPDVERLAWQCRRGMLELDYLLKGFLDRRYPELDEAGQRDFVRLLDFPDQVLHDWLMGYVIPEAPEIRRLVDMMRPD